ncbi:MAG: SET domain-containing protein-lysine N-methyltransferase [Chitinophagaceae bacterium]|nr:SET domain-containing protein-lysine N-methyltransferase [Chitinophagaceae bacterium]
MIFSSLYIAETEKMGKGVYTSSAIEANTIIEISPVVVMTAEERKLLDQTRLYDYIFEWQTELNKCCMALGYIAVYNHAYESNCEYEMDYETELISIKTMRDIEAGEELFINYNGNWNDATPIWFAAE